MKLAAIDIGSNACRLLINEVIESGTGEPDFVKVALVRVPLRLGFDVFETGKISDLKADKLFKTIQSYKLLLDVYDIKHLKACATSAMRDAKNAKKIVQKIKKETSIDIKIITGQEEARYIYENHVAEHMDKNDSYLYIDVGGGSTELTYFNEGKLSFRESFDIGTIRLLKKQVNKTTWNKVKNFIEKKIKTKKHITAIGSGGNINKIFALSKKKEGKPLTAEVLQNWHNDLKALSVDERINIYKLKEDRADVIVPALEIYINVMTWAEATDIYIPKIGLADGLIHSLYEEVKNSKKN